MTERELYRVRKLNERIKATENLLAVLRARAESVTVPKFDGLPRAKTIQSRAENLALKIVEESRELESLHEQIISATAQLTAQICRLVEDSQERTVLILRYVSCMHFRNIGFRLGKSDASIFRTHRDALKKLSVTVA